MHRPDAAVLHRPTSPVPRFLVELGPQESEHEHGPPTHVRARTYCQCSSVGRARPW